MAASFGNRSNGGRRIHPRSKLPLCKPTNISREVQETSQRWAVPLDEAPTIRERIHYSADTVLPKLALSVALLAGSAITAGTTYALVRRVQNLIATATVSSDPQVWMQQARTRAYDACYFGCKDCDNPNYAYNACAQTATAIVTGIVCDGNRLWNWKDRYPIGCLQALGEQYRLDALSARKQSYRNQLAIIILTVLGGLVGGIVVYKLWKRAMASRKARAERLRELAQAWPGFWNAALWKKRREGNEMEMRRGSRHKDSGRMKFLVVSFPILFSKASAYACTGYDPNYNQYFVNTNHTLFGVVHGWFSNCVWIRTCGCGGGRRDYAGCETRGSRETGG